MSNFSVPLGGRLRTEAHQCFPGPVPVLLPEIGKHRVQTVGFCVPILGLAGSCVPPFFRQLGPIEPSQGNSGIWHQRLNLHT